jgi:glycosyltransferase involved in cell wall biosynthesis
VISVVIPVRDAADVLPGQLAALAVQEVDGPWEVVIADNGSRDGLAAVVAGWRDRVPSLRIVDAGDVPGVSHARNVGARAARGDRILFCDADDEVAPGWVAALGGALERHDAVGGALDRHDLNDPASLRTGLERSSGLTPWPGFWPFAPGANSGVRAAVFAAAGGFDESFRAGGDDVDFSWRLRQLGHAPVAVPEAVVRYRERPGLRAAARQAFGYGRQDPHLHRRFRDAGMPPSGWGRALRSWAHLVVWAPRYWRTAPGRAQWVRSVGRRAGRILGSVEHRTLYL